MSRTRILDRLRAIAAGGGASTVTERNYRNMLVSGAWFGPVDGGIYQFLPVFLARLGGSPSVISLLTSAPAMLGILAYAPGGAYAERHTEHVRLVVRSGLMARLSFVLIALLPFLLSPEQLLMPAVILWALAAVPNAFQIPAWTAVMQRAIPQQERSRLNGTRWALMSLVSGSCIALFGLLLDRVAFPAGYQVVFLASFAAGVLSLYYFGKVQVAPFAVEGQDAALRRGVVERLRAFFSPIIESRPFVRYSLATVTYRLALALPAGLFSVFWVRDLQATDTWIGLRGTAGYAALVAGYWFWGRVTNRIGHRNLLLICGAAEALYPALTAMAPTMQWLLPAAVVWGFTISGLDIGLFDTLLAVCPAGRQPRFAAVANVLISVATTAGPLLGAALAHNLSPRTALWVIAGLQMAATLAFLLLPPDEQERPEEQG